MTNTNLLQLDETLKDYLQRDLVLRLNNQTYKRGKLILFTHSYFTINLIVKNIKKNKNDTLKIPIPFNHYVTDCLIFDYKVSTFLKADKELITLFEKIKKPDFSKFYDKLLQIEVI